MIRRFVLGEGVLSSVGRSGTRGMTVVHGLAVEPPGGAPDVRVTGLPESRVKPLAASHCSTSSGVVFAGSSTGMVTASRGSPAAAARSTSSV